MSLVISFSEFVHTGKHSAHPRNRTSTSRSVAACPVH